MGVAQKTTPDDDKGRNYKTRRLTTMAVSRQLGQITERKRLCRRTPGHPSRVARRRIFLCSSFLIAILSGLSSASPAYADPWLDRVERNLKRIQSASKYSETVYVGSKAAKSEHQKCVRKGVEEACAQLIWRNPQLLPIGDWAVGTAHIKRGEIREQRGDVSGALEDYRNALEYHQFPNLRARIKRLELRQKRDAARLVEAAARARAEAVTVKPSVTTTDAAAKREQLRNQRVDLSNFELRHPVVVVEGWAATIANSTNDKGRLSKTPSKNKAAAVSQAQTTADTKSDAKTQSAQVPPPIKKPDQVGHGAETQLSNAAESRDAAHAGAEGSEVRSIAAGVPVTPILLTMSTETSTPTQPGRELNAALGEASASLQNTGMQLAARFVPGQQNAIEKIQADTSGSAATKSASKVDAKGAASDARERPLAKDASHFPTDDNVSQSLARVRDATDKVLTTSALPSRKNARHVSMQRSLMSLTIMAVVALILFSSAALALRGRPAFLPQRTGGGSPARKPVLSVDDIEALIKKRAMTAAEDAMRAVPAHRVLQAGTSSDSTSSSEPMPENTDQTHSVSEEEHSDDAPASERAPSSGKRTAAKVSRDALGQIPRPGAISAPSATPETEHAAPKEFQGLEVSLLRRVSYGAASLIVVGGNSRRIGRLVATVESARRQELAERVMSLDVGGEDLAGVLNPFAVELNTTAALVSRKSFNAVFEFHCCILESIFGLRFVNNQKGVLRHLLLVLHAMPNGSLKTLYECLKDRRALGKIRDIVADIDSVSTRLFFTTVFGSDEFSERASFMRERLEPVLDNELFVHLCCKTPKSNALKRCIDEGRLIYLPLQAETVTPEQSTVLAKSILSVLALNAFETEAAGDGEVAASVLVPDASAVLGGEQADADFLFGEVKRAGYAVL
ncbi:MAG: hypothetical protein K0U34_06580 [Alphaproteobacteria bacterium]|nr:hypothetical protein [Alphaproteobacteria bacterium]